MAATNRMVEKSKKAIKEALLSLMYEKDFKQITVNEILDKANISRGTFYAHFTNLEDVRQQLVKDLYSSADQIFGSLKASELAKDPKPLMLTVANMMVQSRDPSKRLLKFIQVYGLADELKKWLVDFILKDEELVKQFGGHEKAWVYARFISGGILHAYNLWVQEDCPGGADAFVDSLYDIFMNGLNSVVDNEE